MIEKTSFGTVNGREDFLYTLSAGRCKAKVCGYGCSLVSFAYTGDDGKETDIVLGFDELEKYTGPHEFLGATAGRFANRIGGGKFILDGVEYKLFTMGPNHLHGGKEGFNRKLWDSEIDGDSVVMRYTSVDGEENYPGTLSVEIRFILSPDGSLEIAYRAETDKPTVLNLTNHSYFNLNGVEKASDIYNHLVTVHADRFCENDATCLPTGELLSVDDNVFDLRTEKKVGELLGSDFDQVKMFGGFDHSFILRGFENGGFYEAAQVYSPETGLEFVCSTDQPAVQFYTANNMSGTTVGRGGVTYLKHSAFCLETQNLPDAPNKPHFPSAVLRPGEVYETKTVYKLGKR